MMGQFEANVHAWYKSKAAMKSWRFPGTRQGGNMQKHLSSPGQGQKERNSLDACFVCMAEFSVCNHGVLGKTTVVKRKKRQETTMPG